MAEPALRDIIAGLTFLLTVGVLIFHAGQSLGTRRRNTERVDAKELTEHVQSFRDIRVADRLSRLESSMSDMKRRLDLFQGDCAERMMRVTESVARIHEQYKHENN